MKQFTLEQMLNLLDEYSTSQGELTDENINCRAVNSFLHQYNMRAIKRKDFYDYVFYSLDGNYNVNFALDNDSLNLSNAEGILESLYSHKN
jgi:hypothetical protein